MIGGNTTNLNDFNNMKYAWASEWYRQAMNNFWIPEEINMNADVQDYRKLSPAEKPLMIKSCPSLSFWIVFRRQTCRTSGSISPQTRWTSVLPFRRFRKRCIRKATAICSTPSAPRRADCDPLSMEGWWTFVKTEQVYRRLIQWISGW